MRVFINMDEDDDGSLDVKLNDMFLRENKELPFYVDVSKSKFWGLYMKCIG